MQHLIQLADATEHLGHDHCGRPNVKARGDVRLGIPRGQDLRGHERHCACQVGAWLCEWGGAAEVDQLDLGAAAADGDVLRLHVAVRHALAVQVDQGAAQLRNVRRGDRGVQTSATCNDHLGQIHAPRMLHADNEVPWPVVHTGESDDVGVIQGLQDLDLAADVFDILHLPNILLFDDLHRLELPGLLVLRGVDIAETAPTDQALQSDGAHPGPLARAVVDLPRHLRDASEDPVRAPPEQALRGLDRVVPQLLLQCLQSPLEPGREHRLHVFVLGLPDLGADEAHRDGQRGGAGSVALPSEDDVVGAALQPIALRLQQRTTVRVLIPAKEKQDDHRRSVSFSGLSGGPDQPLHLHGRAHVGRDHRGGGRRRIRVSRGPLGDILFGQRKHRPDFVGAAIGRGIRIRQATFLVGISFQLINRADELPLALRRRLHDFRPYDLPPRIPHPRNPPFLEVRPPDLVADRAASAHPVLASLHGVPFASGGLRGCRSPMFA
mmetsp:Transcript_126215/g.363037  ORF Transcript_126215/g.363037 Transcript_126215/m.363037 type:complete len:494 (+) Transcript_126215:348-1829(+)